MCVWTSPACGVHRGKKRTVDPLELELPMLVSYNVGKGNKTWVLSGRTANTHTTEPTLQPSTLCFETGSVTGPGAHYWLARLASGTYLSLTPQFWNYRLKIVAPGFFYGYWGAKLSLLCLLGKHFTNLTTSAAPILVFGDWISWHSSWQ